MASGALRGKIVSTRGEIPDGILAWENGIITFVGKADQYTEPSHNVKKIEKIDGVILPGLVDQHVHGGGGVALQIAHNLDEIRTAASQHHKHGTTRVGAAMTALALPDMQATGELLTQAQEQGIIDGILIEGPFLSTQRAGAQNPTHIKNPTIDIARQLIDAVPHAWGIAFAPENEGTTEVVRYCIDRGITPTWGHTHCMARTARNENTQAIQHLREVGSDSVPVVNHLFNAMRELRHRSPGPIAEFLAAASRGEAMIELIADGIHVSLKLVRNIVEILGSEKICLISDSIAATGMPDGTYELSGLPVNVVNGIARLRGGNLAGGTFHLLDIVRVLHEEGVPLTDCMRMAAHNPAKVMGLENTGDLRVGNKADILICDGENTLAPQRVYKDGEIIHAALA